MKIIFLSKRHPQGKDLLTRPYGRFFHIPRLLAEMGHEVHVLLLSHNRQPATDIRQFGICLYSRGFWHTGSSSYWSTACTLMDVIKPDWIVGFSDTYFGIMAVALGRRFTCRSVIDAYDNYESYLPWCTPLHFFWRQAVSRASAVTAAGPQLADLLKQSRPGRPVDIIPMAADTPGFIPLDRIACRHELNLSSAKKIIGYCGSIHRSRGIEILFNAHDILKKTGHDLNLVLTGRKEKNFALPASVKWLGYLPDDKIPVLLNCLDIATVINRVSRFGNYSYPVKLYEAMRCQIPVIATDTPAVKWLLKGDERFLARPDDPYDLADKIKHTLTLGRIDYGEQTSWEQSCKSFEEVLLRQ
jgi:glycosyltransferase involved in cell wall biosynthesis